MIVPMAQSATKKEDMHNPKIILILIILVYLLSTCFQLNKIEFYK